MFPNCSSVNASELASSPSQPSPPNCSVAVDRAAGGGGGGYPLSEPPGASLAAQVSLSVALALLTLATALANAFVIATIWLCRKLHSPANYLIGSLAVTDLLVSVLVMPLCVVYTVSGRWTFGPVVCDVWLSSDITFCTASILHLCVIALDRYWAITDAVNYAARRTWRRAGAMIAVVWVISVSISLPPFFWRQSKAEGAAECVVNTDKVLYTVYSVCGAFYVPTLVLLLLYGKIYHAARSRILLQQNQLPSGARRAVERKGASVGAALARRLTMRRRPEAGTPDGSPATRRPGGRRREAPCRRERRQEVVDRRELREEASDHRDRHRQQEEEEEEAPYRRELRQEVTDHRERQEQQDALCRDPQQEVIDNHHHLHHYDHHHDHRDDHHHDHHHIQEHEDGGCNHGVHTPVVVTASAASPSATAALAAASSSAVPSAVSALVTSSSAASSPSAAAAASPSSSRADSGVGSSPGGRSLASWSTSSSSCASSSAASSSPPLRAASRPAGGSMARYLLGRRGGGGGYRRGRPGAAGDAADAGAAADPAGGRRAETPTPAAGAGVSSASPLSRHKRPTRVTREPCGGSAADPRRRAAGDSVRVSLADAAFERRRIAAARERKATTTLGVILGAFIVCWLPFFLASLILPLCQPRCSVEPAIFDLFTWLGYLNSLVNPVIYTWFNEDFKQAFQKLIRCKQIY